MPMKFTPSKIKHKLLLAFLLISTNLFILAGLSLYYFLEAEDLRKSENDVMRTNLLLSKLVNNDNVFFNTETTNPDYFKTNRSKYIDNHYLLLDEVRKSLTIIDQNELRKQTHTQSIVAQMRETMVAYNNKFEQILRHIHKRGFKDNGLEGEMRKYNHQLEDEHLVPLVDLLMMRRHEKDYFIRNELAYVDKFNALWLKIRHSFTNNNINDQKTIETFKMYRFLFNEIVREEVTMGLHNNTGLKKEFNREADKFESLIKRLMATSISYIQQEIQEWFLSFGFTVLASLLISLIIGSVTAKNLSDPITNLANAMDEFNIEQKPSLTAQPKRGDSEETLKLRESFLHMADTMQAQFSKIKETTEILEMQKQELEAQSIKIQSLYHEVTESIQTSKIIQDSILPSEKTMKMFLPDMFVLYKPKDIVSGDFYWFYVKNSKIIIAAVDCTGHGVAGAFMSLIGHNLLNQIVKTNSGLTAADILNKLNQGIISALRQDEEDYISRDGMDIALCIIDTKDSIIEFSGAHNPLYHIRKGEMTIYKADKYSIGIQHGGKIGKFTNHEFKYKKGDQIYLFSDGYAGQMGGINGDEKFMLPRFRELLTANSILPMAEQEKALEETIESWKNGQEQLDDILVMGIKLS